MILVKNIFDIVDKTKLRNNKALNSQLISPICREAYKQIIFSETEEVPENSDALVVSSREELFRFDYLRLVDKVMKTETWKTRAMYILPNVAEQDVKNSLAGLFEAHVIPRYLDKVEGTPMKTIKTYNELTEKYNLQQQYSGYGIYKSYNTKTATSVYLKPKQRQLDGNEAAKYITSVQFPLIQPTQYLSDFGTTGKNELSDLSPLYIDFLLEGAKNPQKAKRIFVTDPPTGSGKSFSIATLLATVASTKDRDTLFGQYVYITDTRENAIAAYQDTCRKMSENPVAASQLDRVLLLKSKKDNIFDKKNLLDSLPVDIKKMKSWKNLNRKINLICELKKNSVFSPQDVKNIEEGLGDIINAFQQEIKLYIEDAYKTAITKQNGAYKDLLDFINKEYPTIVEIFPEINLKYYKYIFATTDKVARPVDTIFEGKHSFLTDSHNCVFCIDESDAQKIVLGRKITHDSQKSESDLLDIIKIAIPNLYTHTLTMPDQDIQDLMPRIKSLHERACTLREKYKLDHTINLDSQSASFMKIRKDNVMASAKSVSSYFEMNENNEITITQNAIDKTLDSQTFIQEADSVKNEFFAIIKKIANRRAKNAAGDTNSTHYQDIHSLLGKYFGNKYDAVALDLMTVAIDRYKSTDEEISDDYYMYPGSYAKFSQNGNSMLAPAIKSFTMHTTPERMLAELANDNFVIMLSATAQNESPARNFDFSWHLLSSKLYTLDARQRALESKYIQERDKYSDRVKYDMKIIPNYINKKIPDLIKSLVANEDEVQDVINEVQERITQIKNIYNAESNSENTAQYNFDITIGIIWSMLNFAVNKNKFCLGLEMKSIDKSIPVYQHVSKIIQLINDNSQQQIYWESAKAENIRNKIETCQNNVGPDSTVILWTTYQTAAKGLNIKVKWKKEWGYDDIVAVNESGEKNFNLDEMYVDLDGLYCGKLTHILSTFESEDDGFDAQTIKVMSAISMLDSLKQTNQISEEDYHNRVQLAMNGKDTDVQNSLSGLTETKMYICKIGADLAQSFGRITRCNNRFKTATIIISNMLVEQIKKYSQDEMFGKISNNFRYTTKEIIDFIFNNSKQSKKLTRAPAKDTTKKSAELIHNDLCHVHSETETYKKHRAAIKRLCIPDKERIQYLHSSDNDEHYIGAQYLPLSAKAFSAGYSYGPEDMRKIDDVDYVEQVFELVEKPIRVSRAELNLSKQNQEILNMLNEKGYNFDTDVTGNMQCLLTPAAFSILKGNVGEEITRLLFSKIGHKCEELPSEIYEKADFVITDYVENGCVIAIDSKYYDLDKLDKYDDKKKKIPYFRQKFLDIKNYYHVKKVVGIVINTQQTDEDDLDSHRVFCANDDVTIITIPNIYDENGNFNREILKTLTHLIDD